MPGVGCTVADEKSTYSSDTTVETELPEAFLGSVCQLLWIHARRAVWVRSEDSYGRIVIVNKPLCSLCKDAASREGFWPILHQRLSVK